MTVLQIRSGITSETLSMRRSKSAGVAWSFSTWGTAETRAASAGMAVRESENFIVS